MWAALLGAVVGGFFALAGGFSLEFRRDRRRRIAAARLVLAELERADTEVFGLTSGAFPMQVLVPGPGGHKGISTSAWFANAAEFVGVLAPEEFNALDQAANRVVSKSAGLFARRMFSSSRRRFFGLRRSARSAGSARRFARTPDAAPMSTA
jgi:hypothetical protein